MKIAFISSFPPSRHALNEYGFHVAEQLRKESCIDLTVLGDYLPAPSSELPGFRVVRCWGFGRRFNAATLLRAIWKEKPDVAWFNLGFASFDDRPVSALLGLATPAVSRLKGIHSHVTLHQLFETVNLDDAGVSSKRLYRAGGWFATHLILSASSVSVLMPNYRRILHQKYGRGVVTARSHGIFAGKPDPPDFSRRGNPVHRILAFGKWGTYKRVEMLIEAVQQIASGFPNVRLIIGGGDHPKAPGYIQSLAERYSSDHVSFLGYVPEEEIPDLFREASVTVMPYTSSAGSSGVAHLAAQFGVPIVTSDIPDFKDLAQHERIAIRFFKAGNVSSLVDELKGLLTSSADLSAMAWQNYKAAVVMSMPEIVRQYTHAFRQRERVKILQSAAELRRAGALRSQLEARRIGDKIQKWPDEDGDVASLA